MILINMRRTGKGRAQEVAKYLIGLDNGGTSTKAAVFDLEGREIATAGKHTGVITPKPGYTERDMEELWTTNCGCVNGCLRKPESMAGMFWVSLYVDMEKVCIHGGEMEGLRIMELSPLIIAPGNIRRNGMRKAHTGNCMVSCVRN